MAATFAPIGAASAATISFAPFAPFATITFAPPRHRHEGSVVPCESDMSFEGLKEEAITLSLFPLFLWRGSRIEMQNSVLTILQHLTAAQEWRVQKCKIANPTTILSQPALKFRLMIPT